MNNTLGLDVIGSLSAKHKRSCAEYDPVPGRCDCGARNTPLVRLADVQSLITGLGNPGVHSNPAATTPESQVVRPIYQTMLVDVNSLSAQDAWTDVGVDHYHAMSKRSDMKTRIVHLLPVEATTAAVAGMPEQQWLNELEDMVCNMRTSGADIKRIMTHAKRRITGA